MLLQWLGTVLLLAVVGHGGARLVVASRGPGRPHRASDVAHVLMGAGLAAMLIPLGNPIPGVGWEALFCLVVGWSLVAALRERERSQRLTWARNAVAGIAMIFMFAAMPMSSLYPWAGWPAGVLTTTALTWILIAYFGCCALWLARTAARAEFRGATEVATAAGIGARLLPARVLAPRVTRLCEAVMAGSMAWILLAMR